jgi:hypothetical protein
MIPVVFRSSVAAWVSVATDFVFAAVLIYFWQTRNLAAYLILGLAFVVRMPVSFHRPLSWAMLTRPFGDRAKYASPMHPVVALFSIASFVLLLVGIGMFAAAQF